jgi:hypothetical protein
MGVFRGPEGAAPPGPFEPQGKLEVRGFHQGKDGEINSRYGEEAKGTQCGEPASESGRYIARQGKMAR